MAHAGRPAAPVRSDLFRSVLVPVFQKDPTGCISEPVLVNLESTQVRIGPRFPVICVAFCRLCRIGEVGEREKKVLESIELVKLHLKLVLADLGLTHVRISGDFPIIGAFLQYFAF